MSTPSFELYIVTSPGLIATPGQDMICAITLR